MAQPTIQFTPLEEAPEDFTPGQPLYQSSQFIPPPLDTAEALPANDFVPPPLDTAEALPADASIGIDPATPGTPPKQGLGRNVVNALERGSARGVYESARGTVNFLRNLESEKQTEKRDQDFADWEAKFADKGWDQNPLGKAAIAFGNKIRSAEKSFNKWLGNAEETLAGAEQKDIAAAPVDQEFATSTLGQIVEGVGQVGSSIAFWSIPGIGQLTGPMSAAGQIYQEAYSDALTGWTDRNQKEGLGLTDADIRNRAHTAGLASAPSGALEILGERFVFGPVLKALRGKIKVGNLMDMLGRITATGAVEGTTEGLQQAWLNTIASKISGYDPERTLDDEVINSFIVGAAVGFLTGGFGEVSQKGLEALQKIEETGPVRDEAKAVRDESETGIDKAASELEEAAATEEDLARTASQIGNTAIQEVLELDLTDPDTIVERQQQIMAETNQALDDQMELEGLATQSAQDLQTNTQQLIEAEDILSDPEIQEGERLEQIQKGVEAGDPASELALVEELSGRPAEEELGQIVEGLGKIENPTSIENAVQEQEAEGLPQDQQAEDLQPVEEGIRDQGQTVPENTLITIQQADGEMPGYVQVDLIDESLEGGDRNTRSTNPAALAAQGLSLPIIPADLPTGQYTVAQISQMLAERQQAGQAVQPLNIQPNGQIPAVQQAQQAESQSESIRQNREELAAAEQRNARSLANTKSNRLAKIAQPPDGNPDIISDIQDFGGIPAPKKGTSDSEMTNFRDSFPGSARFLINTNGRGSRFGPGNLDGWISEFLTTYPQYAPKDALIQDEYSESGFVVKGDQYAQDYVLAQIAPAVARRQTNLRRLADRGKVDKLELAMFGNEKRLKSDQSDFSIETEALAKGDEFEINGEKFVVVEIGPNGEPVIQDGITYTMPTGERFYPDKGTLSPVGRTNRFLLTPQEQQQLLDEEAAQSAVNQFPEQGVQGGLDFTPPPIDSAEGPWTEPVPLETAQVLTAEESPFLDEGEDFDVEPRPRAQTLTNTDAGISQLVEEGLDDGRRTMVESGETNIISMARGLKPASELTLDEIDALYTQPDFGGYTRGELDARFHNLTVPAVGLGNYMRSEIRLWKRRDQASRDAALRKIGPLEDVRGVRMVMEPGTPNAREALITRSADPDQKPWRVTLYDDRGPFTHSEHESLEAAIDSYNGISEHDATGRGDPHPRGHAFEWEVTEVRRDGDIRKPELNPNPPTVYLAVNKPKGFARLPAVYIRFGPPPKTRSGIHDRGRKVASEKGVSVYLAWFDPKTGKYVIPRVGTEETPDVASMAQGRKAYLVEGRELLDQGSDEEALLQPVSVKVSKEIDLGDIVEAENSYLALDGTELTDEQIPNWEDAEEVTDPTRTQRLTLADVEQMNERAQQELAAMGQEASLDAPVPDTPETEAVAEIVPQTPAYTIGKRVKRGGQTMTPVTFADGTVFNVFKDGNTWSVENGQIGIGKTRAEAITNLELLHQAGATEQQKQTGEPIRYNPSTNRHNGERLTNGDIFTDAEGNRYRLDRDSGFILTLDRIDAEGNPRGTVSISVDPTDKIRFRDLFATGENAFNQQEQTGPVEEDLETAPTEERNPVIKLRGQGSFSANNAGQAITAIEELGSANPLVQGETVIDGVGVQVEPFRGGVMLKSIRAFNQGQGDGTRVLQQIIETAVDNDVDLVVQPVPFGNTTQADLEAWYARNGFSPLTNGLWQYTGETNQQPAPFEVDEVLNVTDPDGRPSGTASYRGPDPTNPNKSVIWTGRAQISVNNSQLSRPVEEDLGTAPVEETAGGDPQLLRFIEQIDDDNTNLATPATLRRRVKTARERGYISEADATEVLRVQRDMGSKEDTTDAFSELYGILQDRLDRPDIQTPAGQAQAALDNATREAEEDLGNGAPDIAAEMIRTGQEAMIAIRDRITNVRLAPLEEGQTYETILFDLDGKPHRAELRGRNQDLVVGAGTQQNATIAARTLIDGHAQPVTPAKKRPTTKAYDVIIDGDENNPIKVYGRNKTEARKEARKYMTDVAGYDVKTEGPYKITAIRENDDAEIDALMREDDDINLEEDVAEIATDYADSLEITNPERRAGAEQYATEIIENNQEEGVEYQTDLDAELLLGETGIVTEGARERLESGERMSTVLADQVSGEVPSFNIVGKAIRSTVDFVNTMLAMRSPYQESIKIAWLDATNRVIFSEILSFGSVAQVTLNAQMVEDSFKRAQEQGATERRFMIAHNHPSGVTNPSMADIVGQTALEIYTIRTGGRMVDFVVTNGVDYYSMRQGGQVALPKPNRAAWEALPTNQRRSVATTTQQAALVATLRQGNPKAEFMILKDTQLRIVAIQQLPPGLSAVEFADSVQEAKDLTGAYSVSLVTDRSTGQTSEIFGEVRRRGVPVSDIASRGNTSWARDGMVPTLKQQDPTQRGRLADEQLEFGAEEQNVAPENTPDPQTNPPSAEPPGPQPEAPTPPKGQGVRNLANRVIDDQNQPDDLRTKLAADPAIFYEKFSNRGLMDAARTASDEELETMRNHDDKRVATHALIEQANRASARGDTDRGAQLYAQAAEIFTDPAQLLNVAKAVRNPIGLVRMVERTVNKINRQLTPEQKAKLLELSRKKIAAQDNLDRVSELAQQDFTAENEKAYKDAIEAAGQAESDLRNMIQDLTPLSMTDLLIMTMQGNLLTPLSQITNIYGNIAYYGVRRAVKSLATAIDYGISTATGKARTMKDAIPLPSRRQIGAAWDGVRTVGKELISGPTPQTYVRQEAQRGFRPLRAWVQAVTGEGMPVGKDGKVKMTDRFKRIFEGTVGVPAEVMFRLLSLGDRPFRRAAEMEILEESARLQHLKGRQIDKAILFPDATTKLRLDTEGRRAIFTQENAFARMLQGMEDSVNKIPAAGHALKVLGRIIAPYRQFPINFVTTAMSFALPEFGIGRAIYRASKGDRRGAVISLAESVMGTMMYGAAALLWDLGLISEPPDEDKKERSVQYEQMGPTRINVSGLQRYLAGGDPAYRLGDRTVDWVKLGIPAAIFHIYTTGEGREQRQEVKKGIRPENDQSALAQYAQNRIGSFPGMGNFVMEQSFLAGTQSFLEALSDTDPEAPAFQRWIGNVFRMISSIPVPNTVEAVARAHYPYIPEIRGDNLGETITNVWKYKTFQMPESGGEVLKRDFWGEPIPRAPEGSDPWLRQLFDVTKTEARGEDPFKQKLIELYQSSGATETYPSMPGRTAYLNGVYVRLTPEDHERLMTEVGRQRRQTAEEYVLDPSWDKMSDPVKLATLSRVYEKAGSVARKSFLNDPAIFDRYFAPETNERVRRLSPNARYQREGVTREE